MKTDCAYPWLSTERPAKTDCAYPWLSIERPVKTDCPDGKYVIKYFISNYCSVIVTDYGDSNRYI